MYKNLIAKCVRAVSSGRTKPTLVARRPKHSTLSFDSLEARNLLATYTLDAGVLTINGTNDRDVVVLFQLNNGTFDVEEAGTIINNYDNGDIDHIVFRGKNGNDEFINNTFETSEFYGHGGNDVFFGGVSDDIAFGGGDDDELHGGIGNDRLNGSDGNDLIYGEQGEDTIFGGNGDDRIFGGTEDDFLSAEAGDDVLFGGAGDDFLRGYNGNDEIHGEEGNDLVYGQGGDDLIFGQAGNDRLRGNNDNDTIHGQQGNDVLIGDVGDDVFYGGDGDDTHFGFTGNDIHYGEDGNDRIFDSAGNDELYGGNGNDILRSGSGNDLLRGGEGSDTLRAEDGSDALFGDGGLDRLFGGWGDDSLHGGAGVQIDQILGEPGSDRFHQDDEDAIMDREAEDVTIRYETTFVDWVNEEIFVLNQAFQQIYQFAGSNALLRETFNTDDDVTIYKYQDLPGTTTSRNIINEVTGKREIHIVDFDETTDVGRNFFQSEIGKQIGHNWNSRDEIAAFRETASFHWNLFLVESQWTQTNPQNANFTQSGDGQWWYHNSSAFSGVEGRINPYEDFVGIWDAAITNVFHTSLADKVDVLKTIFTVS